MLILNVSVFSAFVIAVGSLVLFSLSGTGDDKSGDSQNDFTDQ